MDRLNSGRRGIQAAQPEGQREAPEPLVANRPEGRSGPAPKLLQCGSICALVFLVSLLAAPRVASAQADLEGAPMNSHAKRNGGGWECDWGYRNVDQSCVAVQVPANAHLDYSGDGWECSRGFHEVNDACVVVEVPANPFLNSRGSGWECDRGYAKNGGTCLPLVVPLNAHIGYSGNDWSCNPGYQRQGTSCTQNEG